MRTEEAPFVATMTYSPKSPERVADLPDDRPAAMQPQERPTGPRPSDSRVEAQGDPSDDSHDDHSEAESVSEGEEDDMASVHQGDITTAAELRVGVRKGAKKRAPVYSIYRASERIARDINYGYVETRDGRKAYIPEAGQQDYPILGIWTE